jgi:hypothetical protein
MAATTRVTNATAATTRLNTTAGTMAATTRVTNATAMTNTTAMGGAATARATTTPAPFATEPAVTTQDSEVPDFSDTNNQVEGVQECKYLCCVTGYRDLGTNRQQQIR